MIAAIELLIKKHKIYRDSGKSHRYDKSIHKTDNSDCLIVGGMVQSKRLKSRHNSMIEMKAQKNKKSDVNKRVGLVLKQSYRHPVKIMLVHSGRRLHPFHPDKKEIHKMQHQENEDNYSSINHVFRKKFGMRFINHMIAHRS